MLVVSRKRSEVIVINGNIRVTIVEVRGDKCRIGIEAPPEVKIWREELIEKLDAKDQVVIPAIHKEYPDGTIIHENEVHIHGKYVQ